MNKRGAKIVKRINPINLLPIVSENKYLKTINVLTGEHQKYLIYEFNISLLGV